MIMPKEETWVCDCGKPGKHQFAWDNDMDVEYFCDECYEKFQRREEEAAKNQEEAEREYWRTYHANMD